MKRLSERKKHLKTFLGHHVLQEDGQHLPQGPSGKANSDISHSGLCSAHGPANNPAPELKAKATNRTR